MSLVMLANQMAAISSSQAGLSSGFTSLGNLVKSLGGMLKTAFGDAADWAFEKWSEFKGWVNEHIIPILQPFLEAGQGVFTALSEGFNLFVTTGKTIFTEGLLPLFGFLKDSASIFFSLFTGDWEGAMTKATELVQSNLMPIWDDLNEKVSGVADSIMGVLGGAWDWAAGMFETHLGGKIDWLETRFGEARTFLTDTFGGFVTTAVGLWENDLEPKLNALTSFNPFTALSDAFDSAMTTMGDAFNNNLKPIMDFLSGGLGEIIEDLENLASTAADLAGGALGKIAGFGKSVGGSVANAAKSVIPGGSGGSGGGGAEGTSGASTVNQTFNMTMEIGGITDRTDKRALAEEIGTIIQEELSRSSNTTSFSMSGR